ncbi:hypothetical protein GOP47_0009045 [Adiantum capillus-veneris]|uniref:Uncharacterized protein n=1 Tax=Adiantum capillus-veneris TaxID=13818 RepID=A0A9D4UZH3_ADICA|nr:hypothetical protein GOP47_0009045 [Adiantum capillus-veneris]
MHAREGRRELGKGMKHRQGFGLVERKMRERVVSHGHLIYIKSKGGFPRPLGLHPNIAWVHPSVDSLTSSTPFNASHRGIFLLSYWDKALITTHISTDSFGIIQIFFNAPPKYTQGNPLLRSPFPPFLSLSYTSEY